MAQKKQAKTSEQRLEEALVPREEQPYAVPDNWCWVRAGTICTFIGGGTPDKSNPAYWNGDIPWTSIKDVKGDYLVSTVDSITEEGLYNSAANMCKAGDLILATRINPGDTIISDIDAAVNQDLKIVKSMVGSDYLHLAFRMMKPTLASKASGSTVKGIKLADVKTLPIPLPPLVEQKRIVERVEGLFAKLDEAEKYLSRIICESGQRRTAIFHKAFCGELTLSWRQTHHGNGKSPLDAIREYSLAWRKKDQRLLAASQSQIRQDVKDGFSWVECSIGAIGRVVNGCTPSRKEPSYWGDDIPWISSGEVRNNIIAKTRERVSKTGFDSTSLQLLPEGTVLIAMIGEGKTRGQSSVLAIPAAINQNIAAVVIDHGLVEPRFLWYWLRYRYERNRQEGSGSGPQALNCQRVRDLPFILPELEEQKEIVRRIGSLLEKEQHLVDFASKAVGVIARLKPQLLADAMRGKLGTNNDSDPSARKELFSMIESEATDG